MSNQSAWIETSASLAPARGRSLLLRDLLERLFRKKKLIGILLALWTASLIGYVVLSPPSYQEDVQFLINNTRAPAVISPEYNSGPIARDYVDESVTATELQLLSNIELLRDVVKKCGLAKGSDPASIEKAVRELHKDLKVSVVLKSNMIKATYSSSDPREVLAVLGTVADDYLNAHLHARGSSGTYELFAKQAEEYGKRLTDLQSQLAQFQSRRDIVVLGEQKDLGLRKLVEMEASLKEATAARAENIKKIEKLREQLSGLRPRITTQLRTVPNQYSEEQLNTMLVQLQNKRTELATKYQPSERVVQEVDQQIASTRAALENTKQIKATEETTDVNPIRQTLEAELAKAEVAETEAAVHISSLEHAIAGYRRSLSGLQSATAEDDQLMREIKEAEENFFLYSKKREEARIESAMDSQKIANVVLVQSPSLPPLPLPRFSLTLTAGYVLGSLLIICFALATSLASRTVSTSWELETLTALPVLAEVPFQRMLPHLRGIEPSGIVNSNSL